MFLFLETGFLYTTIYLFTTYCVFPLWHVPFFMKACFLEADFVYTKILLIFITYCFFPKLSFSSAPKCVDPVRIVASAKPIPPPPLPLTSRAARADVGVGALFFRGSTRRLFIKEKYNTIHLLYRKI